MVPPDNEPQSGYSCNRINHRFVSENRFSGKTTDDVRYHSHRRENHDVNGRMGVKPKKVLPKKRLPAASRKRHVIRGGTVRKKEAGSNQTIRQLHHTGCGQHGQCKRLQDGCDKHAPNGQWQAEHCHPRCTHLKNRGQIIHRPHHRGNPDQRDSHQPAGLTCTTAGRGLC